MLSSVAHLRGLQPARLAMLVVTSPSFGPVVDALELGRGAGLDLARRCRSSRTGPRPVKPIGSCAAAAEQERAGGEDDERALQRP